MDDLISRQAAIDEAYAVIVDDAVYDVVQVETLEGLPTVDAVKVVRCKDCKYYAPIENDYGICEDIMGLGRWWKPDDYCSYGEQEK